MKILRHLPNTLTCGNLLCGCIGTLMVLANSLEFAAYFVWAACCFDFLDGFSARLLKVSSPIGKELDSLADMVSFGLLPSLVMYSYLQATTNSSLAYLAFSIAVFSALRLAKFNIDETQKDSFSGLPTPANGLFLTALIFLPDPFHFLLYDKTMLIIIIVVSSALLVTPIELFALKFKDFSWEHNKVRFTFLGLSVLLLAFLHAGALPLIIILYVAISLIVRLLKIQTK